QRFPGKGARIPRASTEEGSLIMRDGGEPEVVRQRAGRIGKETKNVIVGLDIGTSKIVAMVAEVAPDGTFNVIGIGSQPSRGLKKGVVVNIEATMASIQRVLEEAEL